MLRTVIYQAIKAISWNQGKLNRHDIVIRCDALSRLKQNKMINTFDPFEWLSIK